MKSPVCHLTCPTDKKLLFLALIKSFLLLSVIIVNYNVKYFIEQCLYSVQKAIAGIASEVIVIDNNSPDQSVAYLQEKFSGVIFIANKENFGYAKANNQGILLAKGETILFLNPDTILTEECLGRSLQLLQTNKDAGALGIHMVDGTGQFLPESKRGFPSPTASFFKLTGLIHLFPRSRLIGRYYMGWLPENVTNKVEVLSGAYMMIKKEVLDKTGGFDEQFFMYGEDIDLSYRIIQAGYKNYYLGSSSIVHFKGESTQKDIRYTKMFYRAMNIFVAKHYKKKSPVLTGLIQMAVGLRGALSFMGQLFSGKEKLSAASIPVRTLLIGDPKQITAVAAVLAGGHIGKRTVRPVQDIAELRQQINNRMADEIVFCAGVLPYTAIIDCIETLKDEHIVYKFSAAGSESIVGSNSKNNSGEMMALE